MINKVLVYTNPDLGNVAVCHPAWPSRKDLNMTEEEFLAHVKSTSCPPEALVVDVNDLPRDDGYFNAWRLDGDKVVVDMPTAREIHRNRMRMARATAMAVLDIQSTMALDMGKDRTQILADKQALRDVTALPEIEAAKTLDELIAVWPEALGPMP